VLQFAQRKGAKFPVMAKVDVNGAGAHPLFAWLKDNTSTGFPPLKDIPWNFGKFLIDREGKPSKRYAPTSSPLSMEGDIKALLSVKANV
tara:strand:- start:39 stop:305 length:267 start_codon:yes stop_codon:yes gene_type:complete